jgi:hypothetical protein
MCPSGGGEGGGKRQGRDLLCRALPIARAVQSGATYGSVVSDGEGNQQWLLVARLHPGRSGLRGQGQVPGEPADPGVVQPAAHRLPLLPQFTGQDLLGPLELAGEHLPFQWSELGSLVLGVELEISDHRGGTCSRSLEGLVCLLDPQA